MIHMDRNTSPLSPLTEEAITEVINETIIYEYPSDEIDRFKSLYAEHYNVNAENLEVANGSDEWIQKTVVTLGHDGVMALSPDFIMYQEYAEQAGVSFDTVECDENFQFDFDKVIAEIKRLRPSLFLISMPHNPTGQLFREDELSKLAQSMQDVNGYLAVDEAYVEFAPVYKRPEGEHVVIIRTLSKIYGLAGLRVGIAIAEGKTFETITKLNHPYPVNSLSLNLASRIFENKDEVENFTQYQLKSKESLTEAFKAVDGAVSIIDSSTNFIFTYGENARALGQYLWDHGYKPRIYDKAPLNNAVRYSIIRLEDYETLVKLINEWSNQNDTKGKINEGNKDFNITR